MIKVVLASFDCRLTGSVNLHLQHMNIRQGDGYTLLVFVYRVVQNRHLARSRVGQPCANGSLLSFSLHFLNEMVPMRIFRSRHASDIVDIQTGECIPAIWQEFVKGDAFFQSVVTFVTASTHTQMQNLQ